MITRAVEISIDCAPMTPRPDTYLPQALELIGFTGEVKEPYSKFFGNWSWNLIDEVEDDYSPTEDKEKLRDYFIKLDKQGNTRYSSWGINIPKKEEELE